MGASTTPGGGLSTAQVQALIDATPGVRKSVAATAHGFVVGDVLRMDGTAYVKAQADSDVNAEAVGMVASVTDANNFILATGGFVSGLSGLTAGATYFLSPTTAGAITATEPTTDGQISKPVFIATTTTAGYFFNMRGSEVGGTGATRGVIGTANLTCDTDGDPTVTVNNATGVLSGATITFDGTLLVEFAAAQPDAFYVVPVPLLPTGFTAATNSKTVNLFNLITNIDSNPITFDVVILRLSQ